MTSPSSPDSSLTRKPTGELPTMRALAYVDTISMPPTGKHIQIGSCPAKRVNIFGPEMAPVQESYMPHST